MKNKPLISVIVPVYKVENYLDRCVKSIVDQSYQNLEIVLVDDGSPDKCGEKCDFWASCDKRIIALHKENGGLSDARNYGTKICLKRSVCKFKYTTFFNNQTYNIFYIIKKHFWFFY